MSIQETSQLLKLVEVKIGELTVRTGKRAWIFRIFSVFLSLITTAVASMLQEPSGKYFGELTPRILGIGLLASGTIDAVFKVNRSALCYRQVHERSQFALLELQGRSLELKSYIDATDRGENGLAATTVTYNSIVSFVNGLYKEFDHMGLTTYTGETYREINREALHVAAHDTLTIELRPASESEIPLSPIAHKRTLSANPMVSHWGSERDPTVPQPNNPMSPTGLSGSRTPLNDDIDIIIEGFDDDPVD